MSTKGSRVRAWHPRRVFAGWKSPCPLLSHLSFSCPHFRCLSSPTFVPLLPTFVYLLQIFCFLCFTPPFIWELGLLLIESNFWNLPEHVWKERWPGRGEEAGNGVPPWRPLNPWSYFLEPYPDERTLTPPSLPSLPLPLFPLSLLIHQVSPLSPFFSTDSKPLCHFPFYSRTPTTPSPAPAPPQLPPWSQRPFLSFPLLPDLPRGLCSECAGTIEWSSAGIPGGTGSSTRILLSSWWPH